MSDPAFVDLTHQHTLRGLEVPRVALALAGDRRPELVWRNELDGLTFRIGDRYLKWNPRSTGIDLERERVRLDWLAGRHPAPRVVDHGVDGDAQWLVTEALPGGTAVGERWRARRPEAIRAIAAGLRAIHDVPIDGPVLVHGDACAQTRSSPSMARGPATSTSETWRSVIVGPTSRSPRSASTGTSARAISLSSSMPTASTPTRSASATTAPCGNSSPERPTTATVTTGPGAPKGEWWRWGRVELPVQNLQPETTTSVSSDLSSSPSSGTGTVRRAPVTSPCGLDSWLRDADRERIPAD
jgi:hypothetical protein